MPHKRSLLAALVLACLSPALAVTAAEQAKWPKQLSFGIIPAEGSDEMAARFAPLIKHLERQLGVKIKAYYGADYATVGVGMKFNQVDLAYLGPMSYVLAAKNSGIEAFAKENTLRNGTGNAGVIVARPDSGIKTLQGARGKTFAFVDPQSATGYLLPKLHLETLKINPSQYFKAVKFGGSHEANIEAVIDGEVQVAATDEREIQVAILDGEIKTPSDLTVLWRSKPVPTAPLAYRKALPESLKRAIREAVLSFNDKAALSRIGLKGFAPAKDADYDVIRALAQSKNR